MTGEEGYSGVHFFITRLFDCWKEKKDSIKSLVSNSEDEKEVKGNKFLGSCKGELLTQAIFMLEEN